MKEIPPVDYYPQHSNSAIQTESEIYNDERVYTDFRKAENIPKVSWNILLQIYLKFYSIN